MAKLPKVDKRWSFPHASVVYTYGFSQVTNKHMPMLSVQAIDQYGYQREWSLRLTFSPDKRLLWESHVYQHPGRREICEVGQSQAIACMVAFMDLCENYPNLLLNEEVIVAGKWRPRHEGFVRFCECMHRGMKPSQTLL
jgi:hypothetical protein